MLGKKRQDKWSKLTCATDPSQAIHSDDNSSDQPGEHLDIEGYELGSHEQQTTHSMCDTDDRSQTHRDDFSAIGSCLDYNLHTISSPAVIDAQPVPCSRELQHQRNHKKVESEKASGPILLLPKPQVPKLFKKRNNLLTKKLGSNENQTFLKK